MLILLIGLGLVGIAACCLFAYRSAVLRTLAQNETEWYMDEISQSIAVTVNSRVLASFQALETTAEVYASLENEQEAVAYLDTFAQRYDFRRMAVTGLDGRLVTTDGKVLPTSGLFGVRSAMEHASREANLTISPIDGQRVIVYDVPILKNGRVIGGLSAVTDQKTLREYLNVESFGGRGFFSIMNGAGDIVVVSDSRDSPAPADNFFSIVTKGTIDGKYSLSDMKADVSVRENGVLSYTLVGESPKLMYYMPLDVSDWYLLLVVPTAVANEGVKNYIHAAETVDLFLVVIFLALVIVMAWLFYTGQRRMERLAFVDPVTRGLNRTAFERDAALFILAAPPGTYALVSTDLRGFKLINQSFGSGAGNKTLAYVYKTLCEELEEGELAARISGDVFSLLLKNAPRPEMERRMEEIAAHVNRFNLELKEKYYLPMFQGIYVVDDPEVEIIMAQDRANVARKSNRTAWLGRLNMCVFYDELHREKMSREKEIDNRMESALESGEFVVYFQPKVELRWNTVAGAEALVRWQDPGRGLVPPDEFIPLFEQNGFITRMDRYVFEQVCILQRKWLDAGHKPIPVSVNLSRSNVENPVFLEEYVRIRDSYKIPDGLLELEITETFFIENKKMLRALMERIQQAGFLCSLDDFGSGYSSLGLLKEIPADIIKLDRSFFIGSEEDQRSEYVVQSVLELARRLKMRTVCEGVEKPSQLRVLQRFQCDMVQGFFFSPPVPAEDFEALAFSGQPLEGKEYLPVDSPDAPVVC